MIDVRHYGTNDNIQTDAGPIQSWLVTLTGPDIAIEQAIGLAGTSTTVDGQVFATLVDLCLVRNLPGSQDDDPFNGHAIREWRKANHQPLADLVSQLRAP